MKQKWPNLLRVEIQQAELLSRRQELVEQEKREKEASAIAEQRQRETIEATQKLVALEKQRAAIS